ncbi:MAG: BRO-N domain-containing protein [Desulfitobacteriaceae bacterium]
MEDNFRLLVVGPEDNVKTVMEFAYMFQNLNLIPRPYQSSEDTVTTITGSLGYFDGVLFTGPIPYMRAYEVFQDKFPMLYIPSGGKALFKAFFKAVQSGADLSRISIDTITAPEVKETLNELGLEPQELYDLQYSNPISNEEFVAFHTKLYREQKTTLAFTCLQSAYQKLTKAGVPVVRITTPRSAVLDALERAQLISTSVINKANQLVVVMIEATLVNEMSLTTVQIHEKLLDLERKILKFTQEVEGNLTRSVRDQFVIVTTRELFEKLTDSLTLMPLLGTLLEQTSLVLHLGVGIANTASIAGYHARIALQKAREAGDNSCFVCLPNKSILGPLGTASAAPRRLSITEPALLELASKSGLSPTLLEKSIRSILEMKSEFFTAYDVATVLSTSIRNARRILQHLAAHQVIEVAGKELITTKGKPRNVFRFNRELFSSGLGYPNSQVPKATP